MNRLIMFPWASKMYFSPYDHCMTSFKNLKPDLKVELKSRGISWPNMTFRRNCLICKAGIFQIFHLNQNDEAQPITIQPLARQYVI